MTAYLTLAMQLRTALHEYRAFRHVVRNVYTYQLDAERVARLVDALPLVFELVQEDVQRFIRFLDAAAEADAGTR